MREDYLQVVQDVFSNYADFSLVDTATEDSLITVNFTYQGNPLTLYVFDPSNTYLRSIMVCIEDRVADELKIPAHYMRYNDKAKRSILCLLDKE